MASNLTYKEAGVDINAGEELVERIKAPVKKTTRPEVIGGLGGFGALTRIPKGYTNPVLVTGTDGVGTKLRLAIDLQKHATVGQDLVAMSVNDIVVQGAEPFLFLDYYGTGKLDVDTATTVVTGIAHGCELAGCALVGGETAEMPGMYEVGDYDLAGFAVGVVDEDKIIDGSKVKVGDAIIGIASSGPHSNGYSLIRRIYVKQILKLIKEVDVHALAHITGGGFWENIPRVLPEGTCAACDGDSWTRPEVFKYLQKNGNVDAYEMFRTFNCGVGMIAVVTKEEAQKACDVLNDLGEKAWVLGEIAPVGADGKQVTIKNYENF